MFNKLKTEEHMVLLMLYHGVEIPRDFVKDLKGLEEATLVHKQESTTENKVVTTYSINKRGVAFLHQQRDPYDLRKFETAPIPFLKKLERTALDNQCAQKLMKDIFKADKDKHRQREEIPQPV